MQYHQGVSEPHPSTDIIGALGDDLGERRIVLAMCGSVAVARAPELARLLMRHGAEVVPVMSAEATRLIGAPLMHWATGLRPVTALTGDIEHVLHAGNVPGRADLLLIAPTTANTIGKIAAGIDDGPVTTFVTTAIGEGLPVVVVPAMHEPMYRHPIVGRNLETLREIGIEVVMPRIEEGKAKIASNEEILAAVVRTLATVSGSRPQPRRGGLEGQRVLITAGRTVEYIDPIRVITNNSTGKMGMALAAAAIEAGAAVTVIYGKGTAAPPPAAKVIRAETAEKMQSAVREELGADPGCDVVVAAAAVGDWRPVVGRKEKISTHDRNRLVLELEPTPKIIDGIKRDFPNVFLVAFRAQHDLSKEELVADARERAKVAGADLIAVNDVSHDGVGFESDTNEMHLLARDGTEEHIPLSSKLEVARRIVAAIAERIRGPGGSVK
jgi:phosphopantothenoylcysteine decarboxylase / phosphopantothenate---cysteine ligase